MKKTLGLLALTAFLFSSCQTIMKTARTADTTASLQNVTVADLRVGDKRVTASMDVPAEIRRGGLKNVKQAVEAKALDENGNADLLLEPQYVITKKRGLFGSKVTHISVSGRPAWYENFRSLNDSVWANPYFRGVAPRVLKYNTTKKIAGKKSTPVFGQEEYYRSRHFTGYFNLLGGFVNSKIEDGGKPEGNYYGASLSFGYQFNPRIYLGLGGGYYKYTGDDFADGMGFVPIFMNFRYNLFKEVNTPFVDIKSGPALITGGDAHDCKVAGYFSPSIGYSFGRLDVALQYSFMSCEREVRSGYYYSKADKKWSFNNFGIRLGIRL